MRLTWMMIWKHGAPARRRDAFADPLEAPEWQGLEWTDRLFVWRTAPGAARGRIGQTRAPPFTR